MFRRSNLIDPSAQRALRGLAVGEESCAHFHPQNSSDRVIEPRLRHFSGTHLRNDVSVEIFPVVRSEEHTSELQSPCNLVCRLLLDKKNSLLLMGRKKYTKPKKHRHSKFLTSANAMSPLSPPANEYKPKTSHSVIL